MFEKETQRTAMFDRYRQFGFFLLKPEAQKCGLAMSIFMKVESGGMGFV